MVEIVCIIFYVAIIPFAAYQIGRYNKRQLYTDEKIDPIIAVLWPALVIAYLIFILLSPLYYFAKRGEKE